MSLLGSPAHVLLLVIEFLATTTGTLQSLGRERGRQIEEEQGDMGGGGRRGRAKWCLKCEGHRSMVASQQLQVEGEDVRIDGAS